jgi:hypothetical protein
MGAVAYHARVTRARHAAAHVRGGALRQHCNASRPGRGAAVAGRSVGSIAVTRAVTSPTAPARVRTRHRRTPPHDQTSPACPCAPRRDRRVHACGYAEPERTVPGKPVGADARKPVDPGYEPVGRAELLLVHGQLRLASARTTTSGTAGGRFACPRQADAASVDLFSPVRRRIGCPARGSPPGRRRRPLQVPCRLGIESLPAEPRPVCGPELTRVMQLPPGPLHAHCTRGR